MRTTLNRFDLFPTRVWVFQLDELAAISAEWVETICQWSRSEPTQGSSNRGGWTSSRSLLENSGFAELERAARNCFDLAWSEIAPVPRPGYQLRGWANLQQPGGFNHFHMHPRSALAGVFYLRAPQGSGDLLFRDPRPGVNLTGIKGDGPNCYSVTSHSPAAGEFVVFPGWLEHAVEVNSATSERISIAINCYADGAPIA